jgi:hypothetical protein
LAQDPGFDETDRGSRAEGLTDRPDDAPRQKSGLLRKVLSIPAEIVVALFLAVDAIVSPLFRPVVRALSSLRIIHRLERFIGSLPPYLILVLLVVPFGFAELAKVYGVILMGEGHFRTGMTMFIGAYVVSILVCERTFHAGKDQLMTIPWFATAFNWLMAIKDHVLNWFRQTRVWRAVVEAKQAARTGVRRTKDRLRSAFGMKPKDALERR